MKGKRNGMFLHELELTNAANKFHLSHIAVGFEALLSLSRPFCRMEMYLHTPVYRSHELRNIKH